MADDFENKLTGAWRAMGAWEPPPLTAEMRSRLSGLARDRNVPAFTLLWRLAGEAGGALLEIGDLVRTVLAQPAPAALLRGEAKHVDAQALECSLGDAVLKIHLAQGERSDEELRIAVSLDGAGEGNFNIELIDAEADDILESRPLRQCAAMALREGGTYCLAVMKDNEEIGRVRFKLDKRWPAGETPC